MAIGEIHLNDAGTVFKFAIKDSNAAIVDISAATAIQAVFVKPDKSKMTVSCSLTNTGTDGLMQYTAVSGDLNKIGVWKVQGFVQTDTTHWWSTDIQSFKVFDNLNDF